MDKLEKKIRTLHTDVIVSCLWTINKKWEDRTQAEHMTRSRLLAEFEKREGDDAVDLLMDQLDEAIGEVYE